jgi:hypothetical protein
MDKLKMPKCLIEMLTTHTLVHLVFLLSQCVSEVSTPIGSWLIVLIGGIRPAVFNGVRNSDPISEVPTITYSAYQQLIFKARVFVPSQPLLHLLMT